MLAWAGFPEITVAPTAIVTASVLRRRPLGMILPGRKRLMWRRRPSAPRGSRAASPMRAESSRRIAPVPYNLGDSGDPTRSAGLEETGSLGALLTDPLWLIAFCREFSDVDRDAPSDGSTDQPNSDRGHVFRARTTSAVTAISVSRAWR